MSIEKIKEQINNLSREDLEEKFLKLYLEKLSLNQPKIDVDFTNQKIKRRFQYLNKYYAESKMRTYNALLKEIVETNDKTLQYYLNKLYFELEKEASDNQDFPQENYPLKLK